MLKKEKSDVKNPTRRDFLTTATGAVAGAGLVGACWPFIQSMNPTMDVLSKATTEVDLGVIKPGESKTVEWQGKPVFILHRTDKQIDEMRASNGGKDPIEDEKRVDVPNWLVVVGLCTHLGCVPSRKEEGWLCPCHGSVYDNSGRILKGPAPTNLERPPYQFLSESKILIGNNKV
ncbi:MAG: ubiquinol-cytochrome c reductase iron-sulfur subunit [Gammaproteobacteria bacterium]|nr:ubiquinol-cytochrome c reductase iron-sulfur subunit [Gammaproteobacteria bacterium]MDH5693817.1 ubiquinol-cytochrome c reductase iron-sulfur subunit [Gammaproteobacteria bacterium]